MEWIGYVGVAAFALAWIPQCWDTVRAGRCPVNLAFLSLAALGSLSLTLYAFSRGDAVFSTLNAMTTAGALINIFYRLFPRGRPPARAVNPLASAPPACYTADVS